MLREYCFIHDISTVIWHHLFFLTQLILLIWLAAVSEMILVNRKQVRFLNFRWISTGMPVRYASCYNALCGCLSDKINQISSRIRSHDSRLGNFRKRPLKWAGVLNLLLLGISQWLGMISTSSPNCPAVFTSLFILVFDMIIYCRLKIKIAQHKRPLYMIIWRHAERMKGWSTHYINWISVMQERHYWNRFNVVNIKYSIKAVLEVPVKTQDEVNR